MVEIAAWLFWTIVATLAMLALLLWSAQRGRKVHLTIAHFGTLREALPSIVGATHGALLEGNRVEILQNGDGFFPALLRDIAAAQETIHLESYVWWRGEICRQMAEALAAKARQGASVRVLLDASGSSRMERSLLDLMRDAGCRVAKYRPLRLSNIARINGRDHRKIAVLDGRIGYVFGHGIADEWQGHGQDRAHWRDTAARAEGPIVGDLQSAFTENWVEETGEVLVGGQFFPRLEAAGTTAAHVAYHFQHGSVSAVDLLYRLAFASAQEQLLIQNPYLAPDADVLELLAQAADRGVDVRLMLPGRVTDAEIVRRAGRHHYRRLLEHGVRVFEYNLTLNHQKVMIIDSLWSHIGSTNLDNRSFESNDEISLGVVDTEIAEQLKLAFVRDLAHCREITLEEWRRRSWGKKLLDHAASRLNELF